MLMIISSCSSRKDDSIPVGPKTVEPMYYLGDRVLVSRLSSIRESVFRTPQVHLGTRTSYAFDLYLGAGKAYKDLKKSNYHKLKSMLLSSTEIEWFFLSGGYGIIHALESAKSYQASFNRSIANQNNIPFTGNTWRNILDLLCDHIVEKFNPKWIYVFGSQDYTNFIKQTAFWKTRNHIKMFESTGWSGSTWLAPRLNELASVILSDNLREYNEKYSRFTKQTP